MRVFIFVLTIFALAVSFNASANAEAAKANAKIDTEEEAKAAMCKANLCQKDLHIQLKLKDGSTYDKTFDLFSPVVQSIGLIFAAGQDVNIEADISGDSLINYKVVKTITAPEKTIVVAFKQEKDGGMTLTVSNPFKRRLKFNMAIMPMGEDGLFKTSSCPIIAGGSIYEMWPEPIFQIVLTNPKFLDEKTDNMVCEY